MDFVGAVTSTALGQAFPAFAATGVLGTMVEAAVCTVVVVMLLRLEFHQRAGSGPMMGSRREAFWSAEGCKELMRRCAPEAAGLMACLTLAAALRARGADQVQAEDVEVWEQIKSQWPLLLTADTLLSLQAMLRLVVLLSTFLRASGGGGCGVLAPLPLSDEATALWFGAGVARLLLLIRSTVYMLDGPLGGFLPAACEFAVLPILFALSRGAMRRAVMPLSLVAGISICFALRNRLTLDGDPASDALFTLAHVLDCLAGFSYLLRAMLIDRSVQTESVGFTYLLLPVQQGLAAYYFLQAFDSVPELVGAGLPFEVLKISNTASFGAYLGASVLYFAEACDARAGPEGMLAQ